MIANLKVDLTVDKVKIEKGSEVFIKGVSNSKSMKSFYPDLTKGEGYFYIIAAPNCPDFIVDIAKLSIKGIAKDLE